MPKIILLVGPPGSGKSTQAKKLSNDYCMRRISQDDQGKTGHQDAFVEALFKGQNIVVDRMNFNKVQRERYLKPAREAGYTTEIIVLHESRETCMERMLKRIENEGHPTVATESDASAALNTFFNKYERVEDNEADVVNRVWPEGEKPKVVICDLDGTLCDIDHRLHHVRHVVLDDKKVQKKNWPKFFAELHNDTPNEWCVALIFGMTELNYDVIYCSGRPDNYREATEDWLSKHGLNFFELYMRPRGDSREDSLIKEIILDFEILSRYSPLFAIDDRKRVCDMWRKRGITCLQCQEGNF